MGIQPEAVQGQTALVVEAAPSDGQRAGYAPPAATPPPVITPAPVMPGRYRRILFFFGSVVLRVAVLDIFLSRIGLRGLSRRGRSARYRRMAVEFRRLAIQMGGVLIKIGQFLSARLDVLPEEIINELSGLQDEVPAERFDDVQRLAETELGAALGMRFEAFDRTPMAAASLGQAHRARLHDGNGNAVPVVVKIQRPGIERLIATDLAALHVVGGWLMRYEPIRRRADVPALLAEFTRVLYEELDYIAEGHNAERFAANFRARPGVLVPGVIWSHTTRRVLTLEDVSAIKISDYDAITAAGVDRREVALRLFDTYLKQIFEDGFFHADPHPGNLFVHPNNGAGWGLAFIDFGMVGHVPDNLRQGLREAAIAVATQDGGRLVRSYQRLGVLLPGVDVALLERASTRAFSEFWGRSMGELRSISPRQMRQFTGEFRELMYNMPFQIPQDLIWLGRTVAILSGMCTGLDPDFNLWTNLEPYARKLVAEETTGANLSYWLGELGTLAQGLIGLPRQTGTVLSRIERGDISVNVPDLADRVERLEGTVRQMMGGVVFAAMLLGGVQLMLANQAVFGETLLGGSALALIWMVAGGRRRR